MYNGHNHVHTLKFQSVTVLNGLIAHLYRPVGMFMSDNSLIDIFFYQCHTMFIRKKIRKKNTKMSVVYLRVDGRGDGDACIATKAAR